MRVAVAPGELEGKTIEPGNYVVMLLVSWALATPHPPPHTTSMRCRYLTKILGRGWTEQGRGRRRGHIQPQA